MKGGGSLRSQWRALNAPPQKKRPYGARASSLGATTKKGESQIKQKGTGTHTTKAGGILPPGNPPKEIVNMKTLYAIYDNVAQIMLDHIIITRHDAAAIRSFDDIMSAKDPNGINNHPNDFDLITIGWVKEFRDTEGPSERVELVPHYRVILEGKAWLAMREKGITVANTPEEK